MPKIAIVDVAVMLNNFTFWIVHTMQDILDADILRLTHETLTAAVNSGASDLHFEPHEKIYRIRLRVDGILHEHSQLPIYLANRLTTRIKVLAQLDISERRLPQDGHFKMKFHQKRNIDFRVSSCPTLYGEKLVLRILDPTTLQFAIDNLGLEPFQKQIYLRHIKRVQGMILATGPTGSGKTILLYSALNILNSSQVNISTVEDPVEINLPGINQVNINLKAGLEFATALRAFLRQDPDIIMVGEIRDLETAQIAIKASQTGHLVLSTLHTNTAADVLSRLMSLGIPAYNVATEISLIVSQRLCRVLCSHCKAKVTLHPDTLLELGFTVQEIQDKKLSIFEAVGCEQCQDGYKGRIGIYEMLEITPAIRQIILNGGNALDIDKHVTLNGNWSLRTAGLNKVRNGITSINEVVKYT